MDSAHRPQIVVKSMEEEEGTRPISERKTKPGIGRDQTLNCPRCNSTNTKFCYYNNYSLSQPRYFCKSCRRYWTAGGSLRNIPVGGASRKNKRPTSSSPSTSSAIKKNVSEAHQNPTSSIRSSSDMDGMLKPGISSRELISFMPMPAAPDSDAMCSTLHEFNPSFELSANGFENGPSGGRNLFTVEDFKQVPAMDSDQNGGKLGDFAGFWNGIFGGGSW